MNKCRFCNTPWIKVTSGWKVCSCDYAQEEFKIESTIQSLEKELIRIRKSLSELRKNHKFKFGEKNNEK